MGHSGDIYFEFKTTVENAVIIHSKGPTDYIKISIIGKAKANNLRNNNNDDDNSQSLGFCNLCSWHFHWWAVTRNLEIHIWSDFIHHAVGTLLQMNGLKTYVWFQFVYTVAKYEDFPISVIVMLKKILSEGFVAPCHSTGLNYFLLN